MIASHFAAQEWSSKSCRQVGDRRSATLILVVFPRSRVEYRQYCLLRRYQQYYHDRMTWVDLLFRARHSFGSVIISLLDRECDYINDYLTWLSFIYGSQLCTGAWQMRQLKSITCFLSVPLLHRQMFYTRTGLEAQTVIWSNLGTTELDLKHSNGVLEMDSGTSIVWSQLFPRLRITKLKRDVSMDNIQPRELPVSL